MSIDNLDLGSNFKKHFPTNQFFFCRMIMTKTELFVNISWRIVSPLRKQSGGLFLGRTTKLCFGGLGTRRDNKNGTHHKMDAI